MHQSQTVLLNNAHQQQQTHSLSQQAHPSNSTTTRDSNALISALQTRWNPNGPKPVYHSSSSSSYAQVQSSQTSLTRRESVALVCCEAVRRLEDYDVQVREVVGGLRRREGEAGTMAGMGDRRRGLEEGGSGDDGSGKGGGEEGGGKGGEDGEVRGASYAASRDPRLRR
ncbi:MAG: hypothetical protein M1830_003299 [Pleopsidium flavum]|nr:MAG: hypothetical protein M1830_003299 [Pleopsidium flavum]